MKKTLWITAYSDCQLFFNEHGLFDVLIIDEVQIGSFEKELIISSKMRYPNTHIIYICEELDIKKQIFLFTWNIYDILLHNERSEIEQHIHHPHSLSDIGITIEDKEP